MDCFDPCKTVTIWVVLTPTDRTLGTLEYVRGSHKWPVAPPPNQFHASRDYRSSMLAAAEFAERDLTHHEIVPVEMPAGSIAVHSGELWHGSGVNTSHSEERLSFGLHYMPHNVQFNEHGRGYIFRRYQLNRTRLLHDLFFPVVSMQAGATP